MNIGFRSSNPDSIGGWHLLHGSDESFRVMCYICWQLEFRELRRHQVLEDCATNSNTDRHTQCPTEGVTAPGSAAVLGVSDGLNAEVDRAEDHAVADSVDDEDSQPDSSMSSLLYEQEQSTAGTCDYPTGPEGPAEATEFRDEEGDNR